MAATATLPTLKPDDFKTDQEFSVATSHYIAQVGLYVRAVQAATGLPARGIILVV